MSLIKLSLNNLKRIYNDSAFNRPEMVCNWIEMHDERKSIVLPIRLTVSTVTAILIRKEPSLFKRFAVITTVGKMANALLYGDIYYQGVKQYVERKNIERTIRSSLQTGEVIGGKDSFWEDLFGEDQYGKGNEK